MNDQMSAMERLAASGKHIFTTDDLAVLWQVYDRRQLIERIKYYLRTKRLTSIARGVYVYGEPLDRFEVAQKLVPLSYISLYSASQYHGLSFQYYDTIYAVSLVSKHMTIREATYRYHRVKPHIFYNSSGLIRLKQYVIADKERTICDCLYVFPGMGFDNLQGINPNRLMELSTIYENARLEREVRKICSIVNDMK